MDTVWAPEQSDEHQTESSVVYAVLDALPHQVAVVDRSGAIMAVNDQWLSFAQSFQEFERFDEDQLCYGDFLRMTVSDTDESFESFQTLLANTKPGREQTFEYSSEKGSRSCYYKITIKPIEHHEEPFLTLSHQDVTGCRQTRKELNTVKQTLKNFVSHTDQVCWVIDKDDSKFEFTRSNYKEIFGYPPNEFDVLPDDFLTIVHPGDRDRVRESIEQKNHGYEIEYRIKSPEGDIRWIRDNVFAIESDEGEHDLVAGISTDITERRQLKEQLQEKVDYLEAINDDFPAVSYRFLVDHQGEYSIPYISDGLEDLMGVKPTEAQDNFDTIINNVHPDDIDQLLSSIEQAVGDGSRWRHVFRVCLDDGSVQWILGTSIAQQQTDGSTVWNGVLIDITDRKQIEQELKLKARAMDSISEGITITDAKADDNPVIYANDAFQDITGYDREKIIGRNLRFVQGPDTSGMARSRIGTFVDHELPVTQVIKNYRKDGSSWWNQLSITPVYDDSDNLTHFVGIQKDVTERINTQEQLERSEQRFRNLVETLDQVYWSVSPDHGQVEYLSSTYEQWFDQSRDEVYGDRSAWESRVHSDDLEPLKQALRKHTVDAESPAEYSHFEHEFRIRRGDSDNWRWCLIKGSPVVDDQGTVQKVIGLISDISDQKQKQQELAESLQQKEFLIEEVHHRLKNKLQILMSLLRLQARRVDHDGAKQALTRSTKRVKSMSIVHEKLLESEQFSELDARGYIDELLDHIVKSNQADAMSPELNTRVEVREITPDLLVPCGLIINELVTNALQHGLTGSDSDKLEVQFLVSDGEYYLSVEDNGRGADVDEIMQSQSLGLKLVRNLVSNQLEGELEIEDDNGLRFELCFPAKQT